VPRLRSRDDRPVSLQFRDASTKMVFEALARQTGLNFIFDKEIKSDSKTTIFVNQMPVEQAIDLILAQNQFGRQVLSENIALIYPNTPAKQKDYRDEIVHTFYLTNAAPKEAESLLKTVLASKTLFVDERSSTLVMRDTPEHVRMAEKLVASLDLPQPEVIMEVEVLEITHSQAQQLGINYPTKFSIGVTKPPNSDGGSGADLVWSDYLKQNKNTLSVTSLGASVDLSKTVTASNVLSSPRIRARNKEKAKIVVGSRLPVVTSGVSATTGGSFSTSSVQYVEAGLTLEVTPTIHNDGNVAIKVQLEVSSILNSQQVDTGGGAKTLVYEIGTRNTSTLLELKDGETQVLAGLIQDTDSRSSAHIPGLGDIPILGRLFGSTRTSRDKNEVVLSITPRIIRSQPRPSSETTEFWYGSESQTRSRPFASSAPAGAPTGASAAPFVPGGVSFGGGSAPAPNGGPRAAPARIAASSGTPAAVSSATAAADAASPDAPAHATDNAPKVTIEGPETAKVGEEVTVSVKLASVTALGRIRTQVRFDASALQLVGADAGDLAPSGDAAKVETKPGGVQLELTGSDGAPLSGVGTLLTLRFRVVLARPEISVSTQVVLVGEDGVALAASQATPLKIASVK
jgi:general secretion pathway protein D